MKINVVTLFPALVTAGLSEGLIGQASRDGRMNVRCLNPRDFTADVHHSVDDKPFGGGDGMVMMIDPILAALESLGEDRGKVVHLSPQGRLWTSRMAQEWAKSDQPLTLIASRYAGLDQRLISSIVDEEISIGDYVLCGGELAALVMIETMGRFIPGVLGNPISSVQETFADNLLECPQFTRPQEHRLGRVPEALLSGHHLKIAEFRRNVAVVRTRLLRPDLFEQSPELRRLGEAVRAVLALGDEDLKVLGLERRQVEALAKG